MIFPVPCARFQATAAIFRTLPVYANENSTLTQESFIRTFINT
jgi:hypothetical protein